jgi:hypothetical protein
MLRGVLLAAALLCAGAAQADAPPVIVAAATPGVFAITPDGTEHALQAGDPVAPADRIRTEADAVANLVFADRSSLTLGRDAVLVLEDFAYDPATQAGRLALRLDQGALRYVGGRLSKSGAVAVRMGDRVATLTGGIGFFAQSPQGPGAVAMLYGQKLTVTGPGQDSETIYRENYGMTLPENGTLPPPRFLDPGDTTFQLDILQTLLKQMQKQNPRPLTPEQQQAELLRQQAQDLLDRAKLLADQDLVQTLQQVVNTGIQFGLNPPGHKVEDSLNRQIVEDTQKNVPGI